MPQRPAGYVFKNLFTNIKRGSDLWQLHARKLPIPAQNCARNSLKPEAELIIARQELPAAQRKVAKSWIEGDLDFVDAANEVRDRIAYLEDTIEGIRQMADLAELEELEAEIARRSKAHQVEAQRVTDLHEYSQNFNPHRRSSPAFRERLSPEHFPAPGVAGGIEFERREHEAHTAYVQATRAHQHEADEIAKLEKRRDELKDAYADAGAGH